MLADKLDTYKGKENAYVEDNIHKIQDLCKEEEIKKKEERIEDEEIILVRLYEIFTTTLSSQVSFIMDEVKNLIKYMKFVQALMQTRIF